jgi:hypothetical protein
MRRSPKSPRQSPTVPVLRETPADPPSRPTPEFEIAGLALRVTGRELAVRLGERVRWHRERADVLIEQLVKLGEVDRAAADDLATSLSRFESPRGTMEKALREHQERATYLAFVRDHLRTDALYKLDSADLRMIDLVPISRY